MMSTPSPATYFTSMLYALMKKEKSEDPEEDQDTYLKILIIHHQSTVTRHSSHSSSKNLVRGVYATTKSPNNRYQASFVEERSKSVVNNIRI